MVNNNLLKDLTEIEIMLQKVQKNLQRRMEESFERGVRLLSEIAGRQGFIRSGDTSKSLRVSGYKDYQSVDNEFDEVIDHVEKAITFLKKAEKQPKKRMSPKNKKEVK